MSQSPVIREHDNTQPPPLRLAVQEKLLTGTDADKIAQAAALGVDGIEFNADGLTGRVDDISAALTDAPVSAAAVRLSTNYHFLSPDEPTRQQALDALRYAMTDAVDIGAAGVVLVPQPGPLTLPDLMPLKAPIELAVELMVMHLRSLSDLAYVFGIELYLHPLRPAESGFLNTLAQGVELRRRIKFHPHVWLAADTYHAADLNRRHAPVGASPVSGGRGNRRTPRRAHVTRRRERVDGGHALQRKHRPRAGCVVRGAGGGARVK